MGQIRNAYKILIGNPEWMRPFGDERTDERIMLIPIVKRQDMEPVDWLRIVARSFEHVSELSGCVTRGHSLDRLRNY
jgi:hypothetical protein